MIVHLGGIHNSTRQLLGALLNTSKESFTVQDAAHVLQVSRQRASSLLATWAKHGWVYRVRRGLYIPISLQSSSVDVTPEEPWLIAHKLFSPCYIGGWTAAHYWGFTEQLFSVIHITTTQKVHQRAQHLKGVTFKIKTVLPKNLFGTHPVWIGNTRVALADPTKTVIDGLNDPAVVGGIRMVADILITYLKSSECNLKKLFDYAKKMNNSAIYKRLGFLAELSDVNASATIAKKCRPHLKKGYSQLDPALASKRLATRWNLWVPHSFTLRDTE